MIPLIGAEVREAQFQAAWYYSLIIAAMFLLMCIAGGWGLRGGMRIWRGGDRPAGALITAACVGTVLALTGMLLAAAVGLARTGGMG